MKKIIVKEIDRLKSSIVDDKYVSEYLIYLVLKQDDETIKLNGFTEIGDKNKKARIDELIIEHFINNETLSNHSIENIIEEITFEEIEK